MANMKLVLILTAILALYHLNHAEMYSDMESMPEYDAMLKEMQRKSMGHPDPKVGEIVAKMNSNSHQNREEMGSYYQGDLFAPMDCMEKCNLPNQTGYKVTRWYNGIVPYTFHHTVVNPTEKEMIRSAMREIMKHTCVKFVNHTQQRDYVEINNRKEGCFSAIGRTCFKQTLNLQSKKCFISIRTTLHELLHVLGLPHEQSRKDRDSYINYLGDQNLRDGSSKHDFALIPTYDGFRAPYDYSSIMHYSLNALGKDDDTETMKPITKLGIMSEKLIGKRKFLTRIDIYKVNRIYGCKTMPSG